MTERMAPLGTWLVYSDQLCEPRAAPVAVSLAGLWPQFHSCCDNFVDVAVAVVVVGGGGGRVKVLVSFVFSLLYNIMGGRGAGGSINQSRSSSPLT